MKVLVSGGAGFIGSHIVDLLVENNFQVIVVDNLSSGREENINSQAKFYKIDIVKEDKLEEVFKKEKPNYIIHQAAQISVSFSVRNPLFDAKVNILGSLNLLKQAIKYQTKGIVFASSGGTVYGEPESFPITEDYPFQPNSPYGISKVAIEYYLKFFQANYGLDYISLRYGNVYGPRQEAQGEAGVIAIFIEKMLKGEIPTINGDGEYIRDYIYVQDVARANLLALKYMLKLFKVKLEGKTLDQKKGNPRINGFNLGTGKGTTVNQLFALLKEIIQFPYSAHYGPPRPGDLRKNILDGQLIKEIWGWQPEVILPVGLKETVRWFNEKIKKETKEQIKR